VDPILSTTQPSNQGKDKVVRFDTGVFHIGSPRDQSSDSDSHITDSDENAVESEGVKTYLQLDNQNAFIAKLKNDKKAVILVDSGSYYSLVSADFVNKNTCLPTNKITKLVDPIRLKVANGGYMMSYHSINFDFKIDQGLFNVNALIVDKPFGYIDVIFGQKDLAKTKACLNFNKNRIEFRKGSSTCMKANYDVILKPHSCRHITLYGSLGKHLKNKTIVLQATGFGKQVLPSRTMLTTKGNKCTVLLMNNSNRVIKIKKDTKLANIDLKTSFSIFDRITPEHTQYSELDHVNNNTDYDKTPNCDKPKFDYNTDSISFKAQPVNTSDKSLAELAKLSPAELVKYNKIKYPFLKDDDPKLDKTPQQILKEEIVLDENCLLPASERKEYVESLYENYKCFSLYGEIGSTSHTVDLELSDESPKFLKAYPIKPEFRQLVDDEMKRLEQLGVIREGKASFNSPVMLIAKKDKQAKPRVVLDLRQLNYRIPKLNYTFPLVEDVLETIGGQQSTVISCLDIRDAFFSINLSKRSQRFSGISTYPGGKQYHFQKLIQGLSISPSVFSNFVIKILSDIPNYQQFLVSYMDDILVHSRSISEHKVHLKLILNALEKHQLKLSPKKALLFRQKVDYLGYVIQIKDNKPYVSIQPSKVESIQQLTKPANIKGIRKFCGCVNYLAKFLPRLSVFLKPIRRLTKNGVDFHWDQLCQKNFEEIKQLVSKAQMLSLPSDNGLFRLYVQTDKESTNMTICQTDDKEGHSKERLIGYFSRTLPDACKSYTEPELQGFGLLQCIAAVRTLRTRQFEVYTPDKSLIQFNENTTEPISSLRMKKLLEKLSDFNFKLICKEGGNHLETNFLTRREYTDEMDDLPKKNIAIGKTIYMVTGRSRAREDRRIAEQQADQPVEEHHQPTIHQPPTDHRPTIHRPSINQPSIESNPPIDAQSPTDDHPSVNDQSNIDDHPSIDHQPNIPDPPSTIPHQPINLDLTPPISHKPTNFDLPSPIPHDPTDYDLPPIPSPNTTSFDDDYDDEYYRRQQEEEEERRDEEDRLRRDQQEEHVTPEISPYHAGKTLTGIQNTKAYQKNLPNASRIPLKPNSTRYLGQDHDTHESVKDHDFMKPRPLFARKEELKIFMSNSHAKEDAQYIVQEIHNRLAKDFKAPFNRSKLSKEQESDPNFGPIWNYLFSGKLPGNNTIATEIKRNCQNYAVINKVLFRLIPQHTQLEENQERQYKPKDSTKPFRLVLCVPDTCLAHIFHEHHEDIYERQGNVKSTWTKLRKSYYVPKLYDKLYKYFMACDLCHKRTNKNKGKHQACISEFFLPFSRFHMEIKDLATSRLGHHHILLLTDVITKFTIAHPLKQASHVEISELILQKICLAFGPIKVIYSNLKAEFCEQINSFVTKALGNEQRFCVTEVSESTLSHQAIETICATILQRLEAKGADWYLYLQSVTYGINAAQQPSLEGYSPFQLLYGRKPMPIYSLPADPLIADVPINLQDQAESQQSRIQETGEASKLMQSNDSQDHEKNKAKLADSYIRGDLVYLMYPKASDLQANTLSFKINYVGPLQVLETIKDKLVLADLLGQQIHGTYSKNRVKRCHFRTSKGTASNNSNNINHIQATIELHDNHRTTFPDTIKLNPQDLFCSNNSQTPADPSPMCLMTVHESEQASPNCDINLQPYCAHINQQTKAITRLQTEEERVREESFESNLPEDQEELQISRARFKNGELQLLLKCKKHDSYAFWQNFNPLELKSAQHFSVLPILGSNMTYTGHIELVNNTKLSDYQNKYSDQKSHSVIRVTGSLEKFSESMFGKTSFNHRHRLVQPGVRTESRGEEIGEEILDYERRIEENEPGG
jgi:hypothetical protein